jgi:hypothetical protein
MVNRMGRGRRVGGGGGRRERDFMILIYSYALITADSVYAVCCGPPKIGKSKK